MLNNISANSVRSNPFKLKNALWDYQPMLKSFSRIKLNSIQIKIIIFLNKKLILSNLILKNKTNGIEQLPLLTSTLTQVYKKL
jgi:hypothetical protein